MSINIDEKSSWPITFNKPLIIAGPCSAESQQQMLKTANELKKHNNLLFRAGVWKPRTRPNSFEGIGEKALKWLDIVKKETGLKTTTDLKDPQTVAIQFANGQNPSLAYSRLHLLIQNRQKH